MTFFIREDTPEHVQRLDTWLQEKGLFQTQIAPVDPRFVAGEVAQDCMYDTLRWLSENRHSHSRNVDCQVRCRPTYTGVYQWLLRY